MHFEGQVWFSFRNPDVWIFYRFVRELAASDVPVNLDWVPLFNPDERFAMSTFLGIDAADDRGRFLHAMLGLIHLEGEPFDDDTIVAKALSASGVTTSGSDVDESALGALARDAASLGVTDTPTLYRHGPVTHLRLTEASLTGDVVQTAAALLVVAANDGIWSISKP